MPYVSRVFGAVLIGYYSYANSIAIYFALFAALGISAYGAREISIHRNDREYCSQTFWELSIIRVLTTAVCIIGYLIAVSISGNDVIVYLACGVTILSVAFDFTWFLQAMEDFKGLTIRNFLIKSLSVVLVFVFVKSEKDLALYIFIQTGSTIFANLLTAARVKKYLVAIDKKALNCFSHLRQIMVFFVPVIANSVYTVLDRTMLGFLTGGALENGYYEQGHRVITLLLTVITSLNITVGMRTPIFLVKARTTPLKSTSAKPSRLCALYRCR